MTTTGNSRPEWNGMGATVVGVRLHAEVGAALARVRGSGAYPGTVLSFEFLVLTAARSGEVRNARWTEIDRAGAVWTVPGERMKAGREHRVPLSPRALEVLDEAAERLAGSGGLVFPSFTGRVPNHSLMAILLRELAIGAVPHGFRSSFRDWAAECTDAPREVCELALAHVNSGGRPRHRPVRGRNRRNAAVARRPRMQTRFADFVRDTHDGRTADAILRRCVHFGMVIAHHIMQFTENSLRPIEMGPCPIRYVGADLGRVQREVLRPVREIGAGQQAARRIYVPFESLPVLGAEVAVIEDPVFQVPHRLAREHHHVDRQQSTRPFVWVIRLDDHHEAIDSLELLSEGMFHSR